MSLDGKKDDSAKKEAAKNHKSECIHAVLAAQKHLALEVNSAEEMQEYHTGGGFFTLSRIRLGPKPEPGPEMHLKVHASQRAGCSAAEVLYRQLKPGADASQRAQDLQNAWTSCLEAACKHGVARCGHSVGDGLAVLFVRVTAGRMRSWTGRAPVENRLEHYHAVCPLSEQPDWFLVRQSSCYNIAQEVWGFCFVNDCDMDKKVARVWDTYGVVHGVEQDLD